LRYFVFIVCNIDRFICNWIYKKEKFNQIMSHLDLSVNLKEKIYDIKESQNNFLKIVSYFPLSEDEKQTILKNSESVEFRSIFSDHVSEEEWNKIKHQIIKRFQNELFDIDST
jgi:hypothetical protein